jgi:hypothetical protein
VDRGDAAGVSGGGLVEVFVEAINADPMPWGGHIDNPIKIGRKCEFAEQSATSDVRHNRDEAHMF